MIMADPPLRKVPLLQTDLVTFETELAQFMAGDVDAWYTAQFLGNVAVPMYKAHAAYRDKDYEKALDIAAAIRADDWRIACVEWLQRRRIRHEQNQQRFTEVTDYSGVNQEPDNA